MIKIADDLMNRRAWSGFGQGLLTGAPLDDYVLRVEGAAPVEKPLPPDLVASKRRFESQQLGRDFIKAASEMAEQARAFRLEQEKQKGYEARGTADRTYAFLQDLEKRTQKQYGRELENPNFQDWFDRVFAEVELTEMRRAVNFEVTQRHVETGDILAKDLERRLTEVREDPGSLESLIAVRGVFLSTQFDGDELEARKKQDGSGLISAAVKARLDLDDLAGAEGVIRAYQDRLTDEVRFQAFEAINHTLIRLVRTFPYPIRQAVVLQHFASFLEADGEKGKDDKDDLAEAWLEGRIRQALGMVRLDFRKYLADPMAYLAPEIQAGTRQGIRDGWLDPADGDAVAGAGREIGLALQSRIGGGEPRVLTNERADEVHHQFISASPEGKVKLIREWAEAQDDRLGLLLNEVKLPAGTGHALAAEIAAERDNLPLANHLMEAADRNLRDFDLPGADINDVRAMVQESLSQTGFGQVLAGMTRTLPGDLGITQFAAGCQTLIFKLALMKIEQGLKSGEAAAVVVGLIDRLYGAMADEDLGYVFFPAGFDEDLVRAGLEAVRAFLAERQENEPLAEDVRAARWVNVGRRFALVHGDAGGGVISMKDGRAVLLSPMRAAGIGLALKNQNQANAQEAMDHV